MPVYRPRELVLERGQGSRLWDIEGREYIDFAAGIAVSSLGHGDPDILAALHDQAARLWHTSNVFYSEPPIHLAAELVAASGFARHVFLCNSGAEANEAAIKLVRKFAAEAGRPPERRTILTFEGSFHGRTLATVTATAQPKYQQGYEPLPGGFRYGRFNDIDALDAVLDGDVCAVLVEPIQGESGVVPATPEFLRALRERCDALGALLVFDEIQCGLGRTGRLWAHDWVGVKPDVMTLAKALGAGFPIGAMLVGEKASETMQFGAHGSTFGGNPLAAAVARVALRKLSSAELLANVERQSVTLRIGLERLGNASGVFSQVRGRGLMLGAVLAPDHAGRAGEILDHAAHEGLLLLQAGPDVLRFVPALNIGAEDVAEGLARLEAALATFTA
ncbi:MAG TPA: acetylornithine/succinylornithine family transaminase [Dokdonella sp.]|uniref:acetylornithine/succinylornithine family transaminase n=1 Tax=Dokdonella sp. TaxID=2291710 RepID=UPI0025C49B00|nr:acetylornithine/succinylornithine family transaminase [Dokdonella sp.]MBX3691853.1 acetylornithine/succinylornithine family transaminase [Dokdonella sp.]HNR92269.1 acetylornithine/succinylornithine family transaminase [Dokdonella sp.]